jgi:hypothetical protein
MPLNPALTNLITDPKVAAKAKAALPGLRQRAAVGH